MAATFDVARDDLVGERPLAGASEIARTVCRSAIRRLAIVGVRTDRMRRVDGWLTDDALVVHAAGSGTAPGAVCSLAVAGSLIVESAAALVDGLPDVPASAPYVIERPAASAPDSLPGGLGALVVVGVGGTTHALVAAVTDGLVAVVVDDLDAPATLTPADRTAVTETLSGLIAPRPRTVAELLADDRSVRRA